MRECGGDLLLQKLGVRLKQHPTGNWEIPGNIDEVCMHTLNMQP